MEKTEAAHLAAQPYKGSTCAVVSVRGEPRTESAARVALRTPLAAIQYPLPDPSERTAAMPDWTYADLAKMIDHSLLQPVFTDADLEAGCRVAREYDVASVCIKPYAVRLAAQLLAGSTVAASTT